MRHFQTTYTHIYFKLERSLKQASMKAHDTFRFTRCEKEITGEKREMPGSDDDDGRGT